MEIAKNVHWIKILFVNAYLITGDDGLTLIDTGLPGSLNVIHKALEDLGFSQESLRRILITHADLDHYGNLAALEATCPAVTYANEVEAKAIRNGISSRPLKAEGPRKVLTQVAGAVIKPKPGRIDQYLLGGQEFPLIGGLQVIDTPGHTPGHISLYSPSTGILFAGDSITVDGDQLGSSRKENTWDEALAEQSFKLQLQLDPQIICAGHGFWTKKVGR